MRAMRNDTILAVDVGGSALRAAVVRRDGTFAASSAVALEIHEPRAGWAEVDPEAWWRAFLRASGRVLRGRPRVAAVCVCAMTRTQVFLDRNGRTLGRAMLFRDRRAGFDASSRLAWIERHQPARFARIAHVQEPKDWLAFRLSGAIATGEAARPWQQAGVARSPSGLAGVPIFAGGIDTWASAIGAGAVEPGQAYDVAGTTEAVGLVTARAVEANGLRSFAWTETAHQVGGPTQAGADCARWCHDAFRVRGTLATAIARTGAALRGDAPVFLPYLAGERAPVWSAEVRGAFHGVDRAHGADDFLWSVMEGVAHAVRDILEIAQDAAGVRAHELRACGGGAQSDAWCALKADVIGLPVVRSRSAETGLVGAAMAAAVGMGWYPDLASAAARMARPGRRFAPRARFAQAYARRAATYAAVKRQALELAGRA
jgi:xylulokinase